MTRFTKWQREISDAVSWHQDQAMNATIFLLRETGPTSFVLKEEGVEKRVRITLGDPHTCTCDVFRRENVPCKHICWIILKKFKWPRYNELAFQLGLVEREINLFLRGPRNSTSGRNAQNQKNVEKNGKFDGKGTLKQREITKVDVCPICQEELLSKHAPVTYCKFGCGNSIHIKCMKVWAEHQRVTSKENDIKCPICRASFGSFYKLLEELKNSSGENDSGLDIHFSTTCAGCEMYPIKGKCYKCISCEAVFLCNACFHGNKHRQHAFEFRIKRSHRWRPAKSRNNVSALEMSILNDLRSREITEDDYDMLLQLDGERNESSQPVDLCGLPLHVINSLPLMKVRHGGKLLAPGKQCRLCLRNYEIGQFVRKLPDCKHIFHKDCIDEWLSEDHRRCPIDQKLVVMYHKPPSSQEIPEVTNQVSGDTMELVVPGVGIAKLHNSLSANRLQAVYANKNNSDSESRDHALVTGLARRARTFDYNHSAISRTSTHSSVRRHSQSSSRPDDQTGSRRSRRRVPSPITNSNESHKKQGDHPSDGTGHPMEATRITQELSGMSLSTMLETIDGVLPVLRQARSKRKQGVEKGLVSRRNAEQTMVDLTGNTDTDLWLQGSSIGRDENEIL